MYYATRKPAFSGLLRQGGSAKAMQAGICAAALVSGAGKQNSFTKPCGAPGFTCDLFWLQILRCAAP